jgi:hypothetical protein
MIEPEPTDAEKQATDAKPEASATPSQAWTAEAGLAAVSALALLSSGLADSSEDAAYQDARQRYGQQESAYVQSVQPQPQPSQGQWVEPAPPVEPELPLEQHAKETAELLYDAREQEKDTREAVDNASKPPSSSSTDATGTETVPSGVTPTEAPASEPVFSSGVTPTEAPASEA